MLCKHPTIQEKLAREVKMGVPENYKGKLSLSEFAEKCSENADRTQQPASSMMRCFSRKKGDLISYG
uniref:Uncharacterized protein n=1 Tax=Kalanchoe fedtschenkoi TaxID=63787 RepID=A0A7N0V0Q4_KALFE